MGWIFHCLAGIRQRVCSKRKLISVSTNDTGSYTQWVALKIKTANSDDSRELSNLEYLNRHSVGDLSASYIIQLLDSFEHEGPNGVHQCLVFELLGPSVKHVINDYSEVRDKLEPEIILRISRQLMIAVGFLNSSGICHGGMLSSSYIFHSCSVF